MEEIRGHFKIRKKYSLCSRKVHQYTSISPVLLLCVLCSTNTLKKCALWSRRLCAGPEMQHFIKNIFGRITLQCEKQVTAGKSFFFQYSAYYVYALGSFDVSFISSPLPYCHLPICQSKNLDLVTSLLHAFPSRMFTYKIIFHNLLT